ncbi:hypothetical protein SCUCBS95973_006090 [Sporothrix curviconia]|uniref:Ubiquitin-like domain-containing protein n=1 Tax=Sporothrix curviconia TaxID=1260050 RepID=A0ABP0C4J8_9PEZI
MSISSAMSSAAHKALEASGGTILFAEELTANEGQSYALEGLDAGELTVHHLRLAIATVIQTRDSWSSMQVIFAGEIMEDHAKRLSEYGVHNGDTVYFIRSVAEAPPPYNSNTDAEPSKVAGGSESQSERTSLPAPRDTAISLKTLFFRDLDGKSLALADVDIDTQMSDVFQRLGREKAMDTEWLRFIWSGKQLSGDKTVRDYGIMNESTIHIVARLRGGRVGGGPHSRAASNNTGQIIESLNGRVEALSLRVHELSDQLQEQTDNNNRLRAEIRQLEQGKAELQIRHAMRVSELEHQLMVMKQQLWLAEEAILSSAASTASRPTATATATITTTATIPDRSLSPQNNASLKAERSRCGELESQVALLHAQLNEERHQKATSDREHSQEVEELQKQLASKSTALAAADAGLRRADALLTDNANNSQRHASQLQAQIAEEAVRWQQAVDQHEAQRAADQRALGALQLEKNIESGKRMAAEWQVQHMREEVARRGQQLEYYQQRLLQTAEFRVVKTPFEQEGAKDAEVDAVASAAAARPSTPPGSPSPSPTPAVDAPSTSVPLPKEPATTIGPSETVEAADVAN